MFMVFCSYSPEHHDARRRADRLFRIFRILYKVNAVLVVKNRSSAFVPRPRGLDILCIDGANSMHEFGAWIEGLEWLRQRVDIGSRVVLANDTLLSHGALSLGDELDLVFDSFFEETRYRLKGFASKIPISGCLVRDREMRFNICSRVAIVDPDLLSWALLERAYTEALLFVAEKPPCELSLEYFSFLDSWLHGCEEPKWYRSAPKESMDPHVRLMKATMIIAEHLLTAQAGNAVSPIKRSLPRQLGGWIKKFV